MSFRTTLLAAALAAAAPAFAVTLPTVTKTLTFAEPLQGPIGAFYGLVTFSDNALTIGEDSGNVANLVSPGVMFVDSQLNGAPSVPYTVLSTTGGHDFLNEVKFYYSTAAAPAQLVEVYAGANGTGAKLAEFGVSSVNANTGCEASSAILCNWTQSVTLSFAGPAKSILFYSNDSLTGYDNITVTSTVPEPGTYALMAAGLLAVGFMARRRQQG